MAPRWWVASPRAKGGSDPSGTAGLQHRGRRGESRPGADVSIIFVPPAFAADAIMEAAEAGIALVICITEGIPVQDMVKAKNYLQWDRRRG
jgi:succinyl-CoA synthetase alpha subunit